jgi:trehalose synthase
VDEIDIAPRALHRFAEILRPDEFAQFAATTDRVRLRLTGRTLWHVNSTAEGGGVAEMLQSILGYPLQCEIPVRWLVIDGDERFFEVTKRLHHMLHGRPGDNGPLGAAERRIYESALATDANELAGLVRAGDPVILHDPQTLGLAPSLARVGARIVWSCHIGADQPNEYAISAWRFLQPYTAHTEYQVFSRPHYTWDSLDGSRVAIIPPCIDAFSAKNQRIDDDTVSAILTAASVTPSAGTAARAVFTRNDDTTGRISTRATMIEDAPLPPSARIVTQISRWDPLKDHRGVLSGFSEHVQADDVHLVLAGPDPDAVADDPEGAKTFAELCEARDALAPDRRATTHVARLPMHDVDENAAIVNALQHRADVVVQKSLAEGFGLTVAEAMWKARPTIAGRVGGIQDQIETGSSGVLVDPTDLAEFGSAVNDVLRDPAAAHALGEAGRTRVSQRYLPPHHLERQFRLLLDLLPAS